MPKVKDRLIIGDKSQITVEKLLEIIEDLYSELARAINSGPSIYVQEATDANATYTFASIGDIHIRKDSATIKMCTDHTDSVTVQWTTIS